MRIVFMGTPDFAAVILKMLDEAGYEIAGCVCNPDRPKGRHGTPTPCPVRETADALGIPCLATAKVRAEASVETIRGWAPDVICVAAFGQIIPGELLTLPRFGCINVHASLLPAWRGAAPIQRAILAGDKRTGVTIMHMNEGLDTGDILFQEAFPIGETETAGELMDRMAKEGGALLVRTLPLIGRGGITPVRQPKESTTPYAAMITKADALIDWTAPAAEIGAKVRAMSPAPGAFTSLEGKTVKSWKAKAVASPMEEPPKSPGTICRGEDGAMLVAAGDGLLRIAELQTEGKKKMSAADYLRGARTEGKRFGT